MKKNQFFIFLVIALVFDIAFFWRLFFPKPNLIITPEFGGGDTLVLQLPWRHEHCQKIKNFSLPFWSKNIANGYPLVARGEFGPFNPINILTCLLFDYKSAFNWQIFLHSFLGQIGMYFLSKELGWGIYTAIFFSLIFPFLPIYLMNYMQVSLIFPLMLIPFILLGALRIIKKPSFYSFSFFSIFIGFQFLTSHVQVSFITFIFNFVFFLCLLIINRKNIKRRHLFYFLYFFFGWLAGFLLAAIQTFPTLEFALQTNRISSSFAASYDQNLTLKNLLTIFHPYILGKVKEGTYPLPKIAQPWEGTFSIYFLPLFFLFYNLLHPGKKNLIEKIFLLSFLIIFLISLGKNSPLYLIHYLPIFSAFRFPSRFVLILVFILLILSGFGFEKFLKHLKNKLLRKFFFFICILITSLEAAFFMYDFHVLKEAENVFKDSKPISVLKKAPYPKISHFFSDILTLNKEFANKGYLNENQFRYYHFANDLILPKINLIYNIPAFDNKDGPQLRRVSYLYSKIIESEKENNQIFLSNLLSIGGVNYIISFKKTFLEQYKTIFSFKSKGGKTIYLHASKKLIPRIQFFEKAHMIKTLAEFEKKLETEGSEILFVEDENFPKSYLGKPAILKNSKYEIINDNDQYLKIITQTEKDSILYLSDTFYPGWKAYIDGKKTRIYQANLAFRAIILPQGRHIVEFKYFPFSFIFGASTSLFTLIFFLFLYFKKSLKIL